MSPAPFRGQGHVPVDLRGIENGQIIERIGDRIIPRKPFTSITATGVYNASRLVRVIIADAAGEAVSVNLPDANDYKDEWFVVVKGDVSVNTVSILPAGGALVGGVVSALLEDFEQSIFIASDGVNWHVLGGNGGTSTVVPANQALAVVSTTPYNCPLAAQPRDLVYQTGNDTVELALASSISTMYAIGFIVDKPTTTTARVVYHGELPGFTGLNFRDKYYVSPTVAGQITNVAPVTDGEILQVVGFARNSTTLVVTQQPILHEV